MNDPKHSLDDKANSSHSNSNDTGHASGDKTLSMAIPTKNESRSDQGFNADDATLREMPVDRDDEQLVAYLDGELSGKERAELEDRLINEESLRLRLQGLQRGWDMLDVLPAPVTDERSVQTTLEMVVRDLTRASMGTEPVGPVALAIDVARTATCRPSDRD